MAGHDGLAAELHARAVRHERVLQALDELLAQNTDADGQPAPRRAQPPPGRVAAPRPRASLPTRLAACAALTALAVVGWAITRVVLEAGQGTASEGAVEQEAPSADPGAAPRLPAPSAPGDAPPEAAEEVPEESKELTQTAWAPGAGGVTPESGVARYPTAAEPTTGLAAITTTAAPVPAPTPAPLATSAPGGERVEGQANPTTSTPPAAGIPQTFLDGASLSGPTTVPAGASATYTFCPLPVGALFTVASISASGNASGGASGSGGCFSASIGFTESGVATVNGVGSGIGGGGSGAVYVSVTG